MGRVLMGLRVFESVILMSWLIPHDYEGGMNPKDASWPCSAKTMLVPSLPTQRMDVIILRGSINCPTPAQK